jgi:hypothetical protein
VRQLDENAAHRHPWARASLPVGTSAFAPNVDSFDANLA